MFFHRHVPAHTATYVPVRSARTGTYQNVRGRTGTYRRVRVRTGTHRHRPGRTGTYGHVPARTGMARTGTYGHVPARTSTYRHVPGLTGTYEDVRARVSFMFGNLPVCRAAACFFYLVVLRQAVLRLALCLRAAAAFLFELLQHACCGTSASLLYVFSFGNVLACPLHPPCFHLILQRACLSSRSVPLAFGIVPSSSCSVLVSLAAAFVLRYCSVLALCMRSAAACSCSVPVWFLAVCLGFAFGIACELLQRACFTCCSIRVAILQRPCLQCLCSLQCAHAVCLCSSPCANCLCSVPVQSTVCLCCL